MWGSIWNSIKSVCGMASTNTVGIAEEGVKRGWGKSILKTVAGFIPVVGGAISAGIDTAYGVAHNVLDRVKDIGIDKKFANLNEVATGLQNSQSLLKGQLQEIQFGLADSKNKEAELKQQLDQVKAELAKANSPPNEKRFGVSPKSHWTSSKS